MFLPLQTQNMSNKTDVEKSKVLEYYRNISHQIWQQHTELGIQKDNFISFTKIELKQNVFFFKKNSS